MDTQKLVEDMLEQLYEDAQTKEYTHRKMILEIDSEEEEENLFKVIGKMTLAVSETPDVKESWIEKIFEVMLTGKDVEILTQQTLAHLNSVPFEWGDMIFEDDFESVLRETMSIAEGNDPTSVVVPVLTS